MCREFQVSLVIDPELSGMIPTDDLAGALESYVHHFLRPRWAVACRVVPTDEPFDWNLYLVKNVERCECLGFHERNDWGVPHGFVNVSECERFGWPISAVASHELAEMLVDPVGNLGAFTPRGRWVALEICDPVQGEWFQYEGFQMSNFVTPAWFAQPSLHDYDMLETLDAPWQLLESGYIPYFENGVWQNLYGSLSRWDRFHREDRRLHRTERRSRQAHPAGGTTPNEL